MWPHERVLNEPVSELPVETYRVSSEVPQSNELVLDGTVEAFVEGVVGRGAFSAPPVAELVASYLLLEVLAELAAVVVPDVPDLVVEKVQEAVQEVGGVLRGFGGVHAREGNLGNGVDHSEDISLLPVDPQDDGIERDEEAGDRLPLERRDAPLLLGAAAFGLCLLVLLRMEVQAVFLDRVLDLP